MMNTITRALEIWNEIRGRDQVPYRNQLNAGQIGNLASNLAIAENTPTSHAKFRVAGSHIERLARFNLTGMSVLAVFDREHRDFAQAAFNKTIITSSPVLITGELTSHTFAHVNYQMILLPMRSDMGAVDRILIGVEWDKSVEYSALYTISTTEVLEVSAPNVVYEPFESIAGTATNKTEARRGHLRLVHSSDG